jgi:hypothetical protein
MRCVQHYMEATKEIGRVFADEQSNILLRDQQ